MNRRPSTHSLDDNPTVDDPQTESDPAAALWHSWAAKNSKQTSTTSSQSPVTASGLSITLQNRSMSLLDSLHSHHEHHEHQEPLSPLDQDFDHAQLDLPIKVQSRFSEPPVCFCQKPASQSESAEFGIIYECHFMKFSNPVQTSPINLDELKANPAKAAELKTTHICGFHVHWPTWKKMGDIIKQNLTLDHEDPELGTCPHFNFTYCVAFRVFNSLKKSTPMAPRCFCNRRVVLSECEYYSRQRICFVCPNFYIEGAKPKCSWFLYAEELAFNRPKYPRHSPLLVDEAISRTRRKRVSNIPSSNTDTPAINTSAIDAPATDTTTTNITITPDTTIETNTTSVSTSTSTSSSTTITADEVDQCEVDYQKPTTTHENHTLGLLSTLTNADSTSFKVPEFNSLEEALPCDDDKCMEKKDSDNIDTNDDNDAEKDDGDNADIDDTKSDNDDNMKIDDSDDTKTDDNVDLKKDDGDDATTKVINNDPNDEHTYEGDANPEHQPSLAKEQYYYDIMDKPGNGYHQISDRLGYEYEKTHFITPTTKNISTTSTNLIPASVLRKNPQATLPAHHDPVKETIPQSDLNSQRHTPPPSGNITSRLLDEIVRHYVTPITATVQQLQGNVVDLQQQVKHLQKKEFVMEQEIEYLRDAFEKEREQMKKEHEQMKKKHDTLELEHDTLEKEKQQLQDNMDTQITLRQKCQEQLAHMEVSLEGLLETNEALELEAREVSTAPKEPPKCQVCYSADVECAVVPCFHSVYCLKCAEKLKECALCRIPKFSIQKVYLC